MLKGGPLFDFRALERLVSGLSGFVNGRRRLTDRGRLALLRLHQLFEFLCQLARPAFILGLLLANLIYRL